MTPVDKKRAAREQELIAIARAKGDEATARQL